MDIRQAKAHAGRIAMVAVVLGLMNCSATAATWTGHVDGCWTNAANWAEGEVPGRYLDDQGVERGSGKCFAVFPAEDRLTGAKATTIDLDGLVSVFNVSLVGGAALPVYTFGDESGTQTLPIEGNGGAFSAADTADAPVPTLRATLGICTRSNISGDYSGKNDTIVSNASDQVFHIGEFGKWSADNGGYVSSIGFQLAGAGTIQLNGKFVGPTKEIHISLLGKKAIVNADLDPTHTSIRQIKFGQNASGSISVRPSAFGVQARELEITENGVVPISYGGYGATFTVIYETVITGRGLLLFSCGWWSTGYPWRGSPISLNHGNLTLACTINVAETTSSGTQIRGCLSEMWLNGTPGWNATTQTGSAPSQYDFNTVFLQGDNLTTGMVTAVVGHKDGVYGALSVGAIGKAGEKSPLGYGSIIRLGNGARLIYTGAGETTDRNLMITNACDVGMGVIEHNGSGVLEWAGVVSQQWEEVSLALSGSSSSGGVFSGELKENPVGDYAEPKLGLVKRGTATWTLTGSNAYTGETTLEQGVLRIANTAALGRTSGIVFCGGGLEIDKGIASAEELELAPIEVRSAGAMLTLGDGNKIAMEAPVVASSGSLDIRFSPIDGSSVRIVGVSAPGTLANVTVNGMEARYDANGYLHGQETVWKTAASGDWKESGNWTDGVPTGDLAALIAASGADYAVRVTEPAVAANLQMGVESGTATLAVSNAFAADNATVSIGRGSVLRIGAGGAYRSDAKGLLPGISMDDALKTDTFTVRNGGAVVVDGGEMVLTNHTGRIAVRSDDPAVTSRFAIVSGSVSYSPRGSNQSSSYSRAEIGEGGLFEMTGGLFAVRPLLSKSGEDGFWLTGGAARFSGDAVFSAGRSGLHNRIRLFGTGSAVFADDSQLMSCSKGTGVFWFTPEKAGETAEVEFRDRAAILGLPAHVAIGGTAGGVARLILGSSVEHVTRKPSDYTYSAYSLFVGVDAGHGELIVTNGVFISGATGMQIASCADPTMAGLTEGTAATGLVRVDGGAIFSYSTGAISIGWDIGFPEGLIVGNGCWTKNRTAERLFSGRLELVSGGVTNYPGHLLVGIGRADGAYVQTGGRSEINTRSWGAEIKEAGTARSLGVLNSTNMAAVVGMAGGTGALIVSNGVFNIGSPLFVGGASTNVFMLGAYYHSSQSPSITANKTQNWPTDRDGTAEGLLRVAGGTFAHKAPLVLGADGTGTLEIIGSTGSFSTRDLVVSNAVSTIRAVADANGVSPIGVSGTLDLSNGGMLEVDVSRLVRRNRAKILTFGSRIGDFTSVRLVGKDDDDEWRLVWRENEVSAVRNIGMMLIVR